MEAWTRRSEDFVQCLWSAYVHHLYAVVRKAHGTSYGSDGVHESLLTSAEVLTSNVAVLSFDISSHGRLGGRFSSFPVEAGGGKVTALLLAPESGTGLVSI